jgi:hypothetical protein
MLHQHFDLSNPIGKASNYAEGVQRTGGRPLKQAMRC